MRRKMRKCMRAAASGIAVLSLALGMAAPAGTYASETEADAASMERERPGIETEEGGGMPPADESGSVSEVFVIACEDDLDALAKRCQVDSASANLQVVLQADISFVGRRFTPIPCFEGIFDGQNHTIRGIEIRTDASNTGLFRYVGKGALIHSLTVEGRLEPGEEAKGIGGIAGNNAGTIRNCTFRGSIRAKQDGGGIAGINTPDGMICGCVFEGKVIVSHRAGGIAGENDGSIVSCENRGGVNSEYIETDAQTRSSLTRTLTNLPSMDPSSISEEDLDELVDLMDIGGIAGFSKGLISECRNSAQVGYPHCGYNVGGIAGRSSGFTVSCTNDGAVYGRRDAGGILGQLEPESIWEYSRGQIENLKEELVSLNALIDALAQDTAGASERIRDDIADASGYAKSTIKDMQAVTDEIGIDVEKTSAAISEAAAQLEKAWHEQDAQAVKNALAELAQLLETTDFFRQPVYVNIKGDSATQLSSELDARESDWWRKLDEYLNSRERGSGQSLRAGIPEDTAMPDADLPSGLFDNDRTPAGLDDGGLMSGDGDLIADDGGLMSGDGNLIADDGGLMSGDGNLIADDGGLMSGDGDLIADDGSLISDSSDTPADYGDAPADTMDASAYDSDAPADTVDSSADYSDTPEDSGQEPAEAPAVIEAVVPEESTMTGSGMGESEPVRAAVPQKRTMTRSDPGEQDGAADASAAADPGDVVTADSWDAVTADSGDGLTADSGDAVIEEDGSDGTTVLSINTDTDRNVSAGDAASADRSHDSNVTVDVDADLPDTNRLRSLLSEILIHSGSMLDPAALSNALQILSSLQVTAPDTGSFYENFQNLAASVDPIAQDGASLASSASKDIDAITDQLDQITETFFTMTENVSLEDRYTETDVSQLNPYQSDSSSVESCRNTAQVEGDSSAGGITGCIGFENRIDAEGVLDVSKYLLQSARYTIFASVRKCYNRGAVTAKKEAAGGIAGTMEFGIVTDSVNTGAVTVQEGDFCGGISAKSRGTVTNCCAGSLLSGGAYTGGITGQGKNITGCLSCSYISSGKPYEGAIAGSADGEVADCRYVDYGTGGIDNVGYAGIAEPVRVPPETEDAQIQEDPDTETSGSKENGARYAFPGNRCTVSFVVDDDVYQEVSVPFGGSLDSLPEVPNRGDDYWKWEEFDQEHIFSSQTVTGSWHRAVSTLSSGGDVPPYLAEGTFYEGQELTVEDYELSESPVSTESIADLIGGKIHGETEKDGEHRELRSIITDRLTGPLLDAKRLSVNDYDRELTVRVRVPGGGRLFTSPGDGAMQETAYTEDGSYIVFPLANGGAFAYYESIRQNKDMRVRIAIVCGVLAGAVLLLILLIRRRKKVKRAKERAKQENAG